MGRRAPAHCTAPGKVLLGCASEALRDAYERHIAGGGPLLASTPATIIDGFKLHEHLRVVASQGFAVDLEECEVDVSSAAAPVYDGTTRLVAAVPVSGPAVRLGQERLCGASCRRWSRARSTSPRGSATRSPQTLGMARRRLKNNARKSGGFSEGLIGETVAPPN
ncbi:MAG TPA: IclR family transcriptional regulator C-terminal domain-containing protein [Myxococcota bacterium]|nr:IclR family transcriptional regulator C-terminal domain-containing protein [Myxococcota bacterium]